MEDRQLGFHNGEMWCDNPSTVFGGRGLEIMLFNNSITYTADGHYWCNSEKVPTRVRKSIHFKECVSKYYMIKDIACYSAEQCLEVIGEHHDNKIVRQKANDMLFEWTLFYEGCRKNYRD